MKNTNDRRNFLRIIGASAVGASLASSSAPAQKDASPKSNPIYFSGCAWNRALPGNLGRACFTFEVRAEVGGTGVGTIGDAVYAEINSQFAITSVTRHGKTYTLLGEITDSASPSMVGLLVTIVAESTGEGTGRAALTIESPDDNLIVLAIISVLIPFILPS